MKAKPEPMTPTQVLGIAKLRISQNVAYLEQYGDVTPGDIYGAVLDMIKRDPDLCDNSRNSWTQAIIDACKWGLMPDGREAAITSVRGRVYFFPMIRGLMKAVHRNWPGLDYYADHGYGHRTSAEAHLWRRACRRR